MSSLIKVLRITGTKSRPNTPCAGLNVGLLVAGFQAIERVYRVIEVYYF